MQSAVCALSLPRWSLPQWICSLNGYVREGGEPDARRGCSHPGLDSRAEEEGGIGSSPTKFLTSWLFRWAGLHLLSTAPLNGSELRVKYLLQLLLPCPNHSSGVKYNYVALNIAQIYSSSCSFRLLVAGCWGEQCAAWSSQSLQEGAVVEPIFQRSGFVSDTGCLGHLRNVCYR